MYNKQNKSIESLGALMDALANLRGQHLWAYRNLCDDFESLPAVKKHATKGVMEAEFNAGKEIQDLEELCRTFKSTANALAEQINEYIDSSYELKNDVALSFQLKALAAMLN
ncbi:hypothetical protein [Vibrio diabolicus]|uniref:hypothetical protein n=1 Tax=Vibrio diabolicus TaxID=50719 RepID=UPI0038CD988E